MSDVDEVMAAFNGIMKAINTRDLEAYGNYFHDEMVAFPPFFPLSVEGVVDCKRFIAANLGNPQVEAVSFTPLNPKAKVIENTGIAWSHIAMMNKPVDGPAQSTYLRFTVVFVKTGGRWMEACAHFSEMPRRF